jgi:hypothetical protein
MRNEELVAKLLKHLGLFYKRLTNLRREEWRKLIDYFISDEIVQIDEEFVGGDASSWPVFVKGYTNLEYGFEIIYRLSIRHGKNHDFRTIISCASTDFATPDDYSTPRTDASGAMNASNDRGRFMFVIIPESIEDVQEMPLRVILSIVRLETLDKSLGIKRKALIPRQYFFLEPILIKANGESKLTLRRFTADLPKVPNKIINNRPKIVNGIPCEETQANRRLPINLEKIAYHIARTLRIYLGNNTVRVCFKEGVGFKFELLYVLPCPVDPQMGNFHVICHAIPSYNAYNDG